MEMTEVLSRLSGDCSRVLSVCRRKRLDDSSGITAQQMAILNQLELQRPAGVAELAGRLGVSLPTMSLAIDRLERLGCVRRQRHGGGDGRRINVHLTARGQQLRDSSSLLDETRLLQLLGRLTPQERQAAASGLALLARAALPDTGEPRASTVRDDHEHRPAQQILSAPAPAPAHDPGLVPAPAPVVAATHALAPATDGSTESRPTASRSFDVEVD